MNNQAVSDAYPKLENVQAWMDPLSETFRSLDLVHALNSFLHKLLSPLQRKFGSEKGDRVEDDVISDARI
jgi:hypothetical protein